MTTKPMPLQRLDPADPAAEPDTAQPDEHAHHGCLDEDLRRLSVIVAAAFALPPASDWVGL